MPQKSFIVVGAGLGGLATALRLAHRGHRVTVLEKTSIVGGRNRPVHVNDCTFDGGPTLLMMLDPFRKLFADVGEKLEDHLDIELCDPSYRVFYADGNRIEGTTNMAKMVRQITELSGRKDSLGYVKLLGDLADLYRSSIPNFVEKNYYSPLDFIGGKALPLVLKHKMLGNLAKGIARYVDDPRLRMLFSFQTMYLGLSPYDAPWVYAVLTYMEYGEGIWYPKGGIVEVCLSVARLAESKGCEIRVDAPVAKIEGNTVTLQNGETLTADSIIVNADLPYAERELEKKPRARAKNLRYSCSTYMLYIDYKGSISELLHHNVFFGPDFYANLQEVFHDQKLTAEPAFYAAISARSDRPQAPDGHENLYVLVPVPNLDRPWTEADALAVQNTVFARLEKETSFDRSNVAALKTYSPQDWSEELNLDRGAAFGISHDFWQSAYFRPGNRSKVNPDVYYVGASTQPGNGLPMVLISADLVEQRLIKEQEA